MSSEKLKKIKIFYDFVMSVAVHQILHNNASAYQEYGAKNTD